MNPEAILRSHISDNPPLLSLLLQHSHSVASLALSMADRHPELSMDRDFVYQAALLHDIGVVQTHAPQIYCYGPFPYICHGYLGAQMLENLGLHRHARVCERHTGVGLSIATIVRQALPLPQKDMIPQTIEEQLICFADKFYSKIAPLRSRTIEEVRASMAPYGQESLAQIARWEQLFL